MARVRVTCAGLLCFAILVLLCPSPVAGQATTFGTILGKVTDATGATIPGAKVKVTNTETGISRETTTDTLGDFSVRSLNSGYYRVEASSPNFKTEVQDRVKLDVSQSVQLEFRLAVGSVSERVEVEAVAPLLQTDKGTMGTVVENANVVELPLNGRNFNDLTRLTPGAVRGTSAGAETIQGETFAVTGSRSDNSNYTLDGIYNNGTFFKTAAIHPSVDAIQEFKIQTNMSAQYGAAAGANVNVAIKSGGNEMHGTAYDFLRNDKFDSRDFFARSKPVYRRNHFGFTWGGPIYVPKIYNGKNRSFFFFNYEGLRDSRSASSLLTIPTPAMMAGDLSKTLTGTPAPEIYNPYTARIVDGKLVKDVFANNVIPSNMIKSYATAYGKYWFPTDLVPNSASNYINNNKRVRADNQVNVRIDQKISDKNNLFGRVSWSDLDQLLPSGVPTSFLGNYNKYRGVAISDTHVFSPTTILDVRLGYLRNNLGQGPTMRWIDVYRQAGLSNTPTHFRQFDYPINFGITGFSAPSFDNLVNGPDFAYQEQTSLTKIWGRHTFTAGFDYTRLRVFHDSVFSNFGFDNVPTADPQNIAKTGQALASFLLGLPSTENRIVGEADLDIRNDLYHAYVQDDLKATDRLTLNLGLRYEYNQWPHHIRGRLSGFDSLTGQFIWASKNPVTGAPANTRPQIADPRYKNFAPRIGLAYRLTNKLVLRSAYGIFYNANFSWEWSDSRGNWPYSSSETLAGLNTGTNLIAADKLFGEFDQAKVRPSAAHTVSRDVKTPYMQNWNIGIEQQIAKDLMIELNYQGSKGTHLASFLSTNDPPPGPGDVDPRRPYPVAGAFSELKHIATSRYSALTAKAEKRYSSGLGLLASYAWSHSIDLNSEFGGTSPQNNRNIRADLGSSGFDQRHVANIAWIYELPFGKGMAGIGKRLLGGWELSGLETLETGRAFNIGIAFDNANVGARGNFQRPNVVGEYRPSGFTPTVGPGGKWFNTSAFAVAPQYQFGNLGRNVYKGPAFVNTNLGLFKNFRFTERSNIQFRSEYFNLLNNTNFGNPNGTVGDPNFGAIRGMASSQRQIQFGLKLVY